MLLPASLCEALQLYIAVAGCLGWLRTLARKRLNWHKSEHELQPEEELPQLLQCSLNWVNVIIGKDFH